MSAYVLDTDTLTLYQFGHPTVVANVDRHRQDGHQLMLAVVTVEEQSLGRLAALRTARTPTGVADAYRLFAETATSWGRFEIVPFPVAALSIFDGLVRSRLNVGRNDLKIAAVALERAATVVTRNRRDFTRVPGLPVEDWAA